MRRYWGCKCQIDVLLRVGAMLLDNLEGHGLVVEHVTNGQQALRRSAKFRPHIVFLDWSLPGMCGIEVCRRLRSHPETKDVGVIMVTARTGDQNAVRGLNAGADDYVVKPFSITELLARIRALLSSQLSRGSQPRWACFREKMPDAHPTVSAR
jgi:two-component system phosphate regulon response regulator PhoB